MSDVLFLSFALSTLLQTAHLHVFILFSSEICPVLGKPLYGEKIGKSESLSGDKVTFRCNSVFDLVGSVVLYCDQGQWNGSVPRCLGKTLR